MRRYCRLAQLVEQRGSNVKVCLSVYEQLFFLSAPAPILWWLCHGVCACLFVCLLVGLFVGGWVFGLKIPWSEWLEICHSSRPRHCVQNYWFRVKGWVWGLGWDWRWGWVGGLCFRVTVGESAPIGISRECTYLLFEIIFIVVNLVMLKRKGISLYTLKIKLLIFKFHSLSLFQIGTHTMPKSEAVRHAPRLTLPNRNLISALTLLNKLCAWRHNVPPQSAPCELTISSYLFCPGGTCSGMLAI